MGARTTSISAVAESLGLFVTLWTDGIFRTAEGFVPVFDPSIETFHGFGAVGHAQRADGHARVVGSTIAVGTLRRIMGDGIAHNMHNAAVGMSLDALFVKYATASTPTDLYETVLGAYELN